jgi:alpha-ketoglutarate-dependent taurine dioxygenase
MNLHDSTLAPDGVLLEPAPRFPLVIRQAADGAELARWAAEHARWIEGRLLVHGALLFRGFGLSSIEAFERAARALCPRLHADYGDLPRELEGEQVYKATPYASHLPILFHNEASHTRLWPLRQMFGCLQPAASGGETVISDGRAVYRRLAPRVRDRFEALGLLYERNFVECLDVSWQDFFKTHDRDAAAGACRRQGVEHRWTERGLRTRWPAQAVARHPRTGEPVWFNQIQLHHPDCLDARVRRNLEALFGEEDLPRNVRYGDGSPIEDEALREIAAALDGAATEVRWEAGDLLLLDNMLVAHARRPYTGVRRIVVAMGEMIAAAPAAGRAQRASRPRSGPRPPSAAHAARARR